MVSGAWLCPGGRVDVPGHRNGDGPCWPGDYAWAEQQRPGKLASPIPSLFAWACFCLEPRCGDETVHRLGTGSHHVAGNRSHGFSRGYGRVPVGRRAVGSSARGTAPPHVGVASGWAVLRYRRLCISFQSEVALQRWSQTTRKRGLWGTRGNLHRIVENVPRSTVLWLGAKWGLRGARAADDGYRKDPRELGIPTR